MPRPSRGKRLDMVAATWGGLVGSIGLMAGASRDLPLRLVAAAIAFLVGGFLAGMRTHGRRATHGAMATVIAYVMYAAFVVLATAIDAVGGPSAPALVPGSNGREWLIAAGWALLLCVVGALAANSILSPRRRGRRYRSRSISRW